MHVYLGPNRNKVPSKIQYIGQTLLWLVIPVDARKWLDITSPWMRLSISIQHFCSHQCLMRVWYTKLDSNSIVWHSDTKTSSLHHFTYNYFIRGLTEMKCLPKNCIKTNFATLIHHTISSAHWYRLIGRVN